MAAPRASNVSVKEESDRVTDLEAELPSSAVPLNRALQGLQKEVNSERTTQPTSNPAWSHKAPQLYLFISTHQQFQACSLQFKLDATNPAISEG